MSEYDGHEPFPVCPHCGATDDDITDIDSDNIEDGVEWVHECPACDREYGVRTYVTIAFAMKGGGT